MPPQNKTEFPLVHARLRQIMESYSGRGLTPIADNAENFILGGPKTETSWGREVWFGGVQTRKNYVSYHLMPVYALPELVKEISPQLKKRMQGKSCFNFTRVDETLFSELAALTEKGYQRFKAGGLIK